MKKLLILGNYEDAIYHPFTGVDECLMSIFSGFDTECTSDLSRLTQIESEGFSGVVSYLDIWNGCPSCEEAEALDKFIEHGGALLVLHNGISLQSSEKLRLLMGGAFVSHPAMEEIKLKPMPHAITEGCRDFVLLEEPYQFDMTDDNKEIFLSYEYRGDDYTAGWCKTVGRGRVAFLMPGHTPEIFKNSAYAELIKRSMNWCLAAE